MVGAAVYFQRLIRGFLVSYEGFSFGVMVSKRFVVSYTNFCHSKMYVCTEDMSACRFFFPETRFKIHVSAINKRPENCLMATFFSKTGLPASGDPNVS